MRVLLINPNNHHVLRSNFPIEIERGIGSFPPLGLLYVASFLRQQGHEVKVLDMQLEDMDCKALAGEMRIFQPSVAGIYATTFHIVDILLVAKTIKASGPVHVCLGGPHVNIFPEETIAHPDIDSLVLGEGEKTFAALADAIEKGGPFDAIPGIVYKRGGKVFKTSLPVLHQELDALPFPDRRMVDYTRYHNITSRSYPSTTMISSRGCSAGCSFCYNRHLGKKVRFRSAENIISEMKQCMELGIKDIFFYDDTFILSRERADSFCDRLADSGLKMGWGIKTRVDQVNPRILAKLRKAGCYRIHFGVESGNDRILAGLNKGITVDQARRAFRQSREAGIETLAYFMIGSPDERRADILETISFAVGLNPDYVHFSITMPLPDTDMYARGLRSGILSHDFWREFAAHPRAHFTPPYWNECLSDDELTALLKYAYKAFYFRPGYLLKLLMKVTSLRELRKKTEIAKQIFGFFFR